MTTEKLNFSFKSSFFAFKNNSKIEIENQKIKVNFPNMKFGVLQDGSKSFEIEKENIFSIGFSFVSSVIFGIIGAIFIFMGILQLDRIYYQEEYGIYAMISFLLGFFGGVYMYENIIKPKKKLEEMTLSIEFLVKGVFVVISVILFLIVLFKIGFVAIFSGLLLTIGILFILSVLSLQFQIIDKKGIAYNFPVLFWQFGEVNRIFRANFSEFFKEKVVKISEEKNIEKSEKNIENQKSTETEENSENKKIYTRNLGKSNKGLLGILIGALITTIIAYFLPIMPGEADSTLFKIIQMGVKRSGSELGIFAFILPIISIVLLIIITFLKNILGIIKIFVNIFSGIALFSIFGLAFFPIYYINLFIGRMSAREVSSISEEISFGLWVIFFIISLILMTIYTFKINSKK